VTDLPRRQALRALGTAGLAATAGCAALGGGTDGVGLVGVKVRSIFTDPISVRVELSRDGRPVFAETLTASDGSPANRQADWSTDPATYDCQFAALDDPFVGDIHRDEGLADDRIDDGASDCYVATVSMSDTDGPAVYLELWPASDFSEFDCGG